MSLPLPETNNSYSCIKELTLAGQPVKITLDYLNQRVKVQNYASNQINHLVHYLNQFAKTHTFGKCIITAREEDWKKFLANGYVVEAVNSHYYSGLPCYYMTKFWQKERSISSLRVEEDAILDKILENCINSEPPHLPAGFVLRSAVQEDLSQLTLFYSSIFSSYPSPISNPGFLRQFLYKNPFKVVLKEGRIVGAASAELDPDGMAAELTDCACLPEFRNRGLMSCLIYSLEQELVNSSYEHLYSIARALQPGINAIFHKLGYTYGGRFINNCTICGQFEDMNLWFK